MDNNFNTNDYYQSTENQYRMSQDSVNQQVNYSQQNPYGNGYNQYNAGQNPYGAGQNPYGENQNPYGQNPYGAGQNPYYQNGYTAAPRAAVDVNDVVTKSFLLMFVALLVTGITSLIAAQQNFLFSDVDTAYIKVIVCFAAELALVFAATAAMKKNNVLLSGILFFAYCVVNALTFSIIFYAYELGSIAQVFIITAIIFGVMAAIGFFTKADLTKLGTILMVGLLGIIIASVVNMFIGSSGLDLIITIIGIVIFIGLTAYDVQKIKYLATSNSGLDPMVLGLYGAMTLYLDFINLFLKLLRILGRSRN